MVSVCTGSNTNTTSCPDPHSCQTYLKQFSYFNLFLKMVLYQISLFIECHYLLRNYTEQKAASCLNQMTTAYFLDVFYLLLHKNKQLGGPEIKAWV